MLFRSILADRGGWHMAGAGEHGVEPQQPARGHLRHAADLAGAREVDPFGAEQRDEVVSRAADRVLGRGKSKGLPHRPVQPWAGIGALRPDAVVERADDDGIGLLQSRLERPPDRQSWMDRVLRPHDLVTHQRAIEVRVVAGLQGEWVNAWIEKLRENRLRRRAGLILPAIVLLTAVYWLLRLFA